MTANELRLVASNLAVLIEINFLAGFLNSVQDPVVKSCSRHPIEIIKSACSANLFAGSQPVTPTGPHHAGSEANNVDFPATVSTTGTPNLAANSEITLCALLYLAPPPAIIKGFLAVLIISTALFIEL